jgi:hypothetical protein
VIVSWDTSSSVSAFFSTVTRLVQRLAWQVDPAQEEINLIPFRDPSSVPLMPQWSGDPAALYGALHAYSWADSSSNAEGALLAAATALASRVGSRAVALITDASFSGTYENEKLWDALAFGRVRVFALHLPAEADPVRARAQADLMLDWSNAAGGVYARFASQGDAEAAFRRMFAWLRRPAAYDFTLAADTAPPPPGRLVVRNAPREPGATSDPASEPAGAAVEIVLDASGSMLQKLHGKRRIDIARQALDALVAPGLPPGTRLALRVFGKSKAGLCATDLSLALGPLDTAAFKSVLGKIKPVNGAKTPIAASLRKAGEDLAGAIGPKLVVLVTDGEETCDGDPEREIARLRTAGLDVRVNIVGFAVEEAAIKDAFARWAAAGGGGFFDAADAGALQEALQAALRTPYDVLAEDGSVAATGIVDGPALELAPGRYGLRLPGAAAPFAQVEVVSGGTATVERGP